MIAYSQLSHYMMISFQTAWIMAVGCLVASLTHILIVRCAVKLLKETQHAMHLLIAMFSSADLVLTGKAQTHLHNIVTVFQHSRSPWNSCRLLLADRSPPGSYAS